MIILAFLSCMSNKKLAELEATTQENSERIRMLEGRIQGISKEKLKQADDSREKEAVEMYREIQIVLRDDEIETAQRMLHDMEKRYGDTRVWRRASRTKAELDIVGSKVPKNIGSVDWYQGEGEVDMYSGTTILIFLGDLVSTLQKRASTSTGTLSKSEGPGCTNCRFHKTLSQWSTGKSSELHSGEEYRISNG